MVREKMRPEYLITAQIEAGLSGELRRRLEEIRTES
jgi:hypothetical protein